MTNVLNLLAFGFAVFLLLKKISEMDRFLYLRVVLLTVFICWALIYFFVLYVGDTNRPDYVCEPRQYCVTEYAGPFSLPVVE
ncbi:MAG TPA: hypothetical protein VJ749_13295 [Pyrinomonadaceae bacterium]|nr:hypothetical protein [Pyrinomonadaceae bacterium]